MTKSVKLSAATVRALRAADAALAKSSQTVQVQFQAFAGLIAKTYPDGVKASELFRTIHGADAATKVDGKPTAEYTRAARAVRAAFPQAVKARGVKASKASKGKASKAKPDATRAPAAPSAAMVAEWITDSANRAALVKFARAHAATKRAFAEIAAAVAAK